MSQNDRFWADDEDNGVPQPRSLPHVPPFAEQKSVRSVFVQGNDPLLDETDGGAMNMAGCYDDIMSSIADHEDWQEGYDY